ncbi:hypothetical protein [Arcticibacter sp. MXS-1]|uniref:hypothetical protein n=1 Tax=Arcticibacter sp. MXS-1 TaxID=3341726 RepID=UPI0035A97ABF
MEIKVKVLITAAATAQAYQLERILGEGVDTCFADSGELPGFMFKNKKFLTIQKGSAVSFAHELLTTCLDYEITHVFLLRREEIIALSEARTLFTEYGIEVVVPSAKIVKRLPFRTKPGSIGVKANGFHIGEVPLDADRGVFLSSPDDSGNFSIFSVS